MTELRSIISALDRNTIVFCTLVWSDSTGVSLIPRDVIKEIAVLSQAPIYSFWSPFINTGIVGGHMLDGTVVGSQLLNAVMDYLNDGRFKDSYCTLQTYFDWNAVDRYDINTDTIFADAIVINKPSNIFIEHRYELTIIGISILLMTISAAFWLYKLSILNKKLRRNRDELEIRIDERTHELKEINDHLHDSEMRFHSLSDAAFEGIIITSNELIIEANNAIVQMFGYMPKEYIGKNATDFISDNGRDNVKNKILSGYEEPYESSCVRKDGSVFPVEIRGKTFLYRGKQVRVTAIRDITNRKKAEEALKEANERLKDMAMQDGLTGIANRRNFDIKLEKEWRRAMRDNSELSLIIFDVDFFKSYNDTYGHQAGDVCLQTIAKKAFILLKRPGDLFARYGGEEFVAILPDTDNEGASSVAEHVRRNIYELKMPHDSSDVCRYVTVSCGVASVVPTKTITPKYLLEAADKALYQAKETGRNKVVSKIFES